MTNIDIFSPFARRADRHEDRLTWGFLVALKYSPELQRYLRDLVLKEIPPDRWPLTPSWEPAAIMTQTSRIGPSAAFVVSVLMSDDSLDEAIGVEKADRTARYDGVIEYPDGLVLVIENKPSRGNVWAGQLSPSRASFDAMSDEAVLYEKNVSIEWAEILEGLLVYTGSQVASYAERSVASDFLSFAESFHPSLSPYRTFELCGTRPEALSKRIEALLEVMAGRLGHEVGKRPGGVPYIHLPNEAVRQLHLRVHEREGDAEPALRLSLWPGDTVPQSRALLRSVVTQALRKLEESGWVVRPNLHFSHMQKHLVWATTTLPVSDYISYFSENRGEVGKSSFEDQPLDEVTTRWLGLGLISETDVDALNRQFGETRRRSMNVIPGLSLRRDWPLTKIRELESEGQLEKELWEAAREPFSAWREELPRWVST